MTRIKLTIEYDGSYYLGWQKQNSGKTVQREIEKSLEILFGREINIYVAGRTDAGVHALGQVVHFDVVQSKMEYKKISLALNYLLKKNKNKISILKSEKVVKSFDSRFSVKNKIYLYKILNRASPSYVHEKRVWFITKKLDLETMKQSSNHLVGKFDFNAFRSTQCQAKTSIRSIDKIKIKKEKDLIQIRVLGRSFLHNQVRIIIGTLVNVGKGIWDDKKIVNILNSKDRRNAGPTAPPHGLYLEKINY